jgi:Protein of unknown function (DUF3775)
MVELSLSPDYIGLLAVKMRAVQGREGLSDPDSGSNPIDDNMIDTLEDTPDDLSREEVREEIQGLGPRPQAELVALLWTGRGDAEPEEWEATVDLASQSRDTPTPHYLLGQPLVAEYILDGLEKLGIPDPLANDR